MALTLVFWMALAMSVFVVATTVFGLRFVLPGLQESAPIQLPERFLVVLRASSLGGGAIATLGFLTLALGEWTRVGTVGRIGIVGILLGGPLFSVGVGATIALWLRVWVANKKGKSTRERARGER